MVDGFGSSLQSNVQCGSSREDLAVPTNLLNLAKEAFDARQSYGTQAENVVEDPGYLRLGPHTKARYVSPAFFAMISKEVGAGALDI